MENFAGNCWEFDDSFGKTCDEPKNGSAYIETEEHGRNLLYVGSRSSLPYRNLKEEIHSGVLDLQVARLRLLVL